MSLPKTINNPSVRWGFHPHLCETRCGGPLSDIDLGHFLDFKIQFFYTTISLNKLNIPPKAAKKVLENEIF